ncbi:Hypothetical protein PHPALM_18683 [Phytophthora palmivora]|uniref:Uncharacterized protein n=1 Tax=Phytophthora palmivora TaxID=4796 RepID=A0A2P4XJ41_9STRA|nr:Hypothetical protein PHPALM_18683 [Phytophthora palmivora]
MEKKLDNFCLKRDSGGFISKAPPCSKADMKKMLVYLYVNARCSKPRIRKPNISIDAGNVLFVRFIRMKISEEQGLPLFPGSVGNNHVARHGAGDANADRLINGRHRQPTRHARPSCNHSIPGRTAPGYPRTPR